MAITYDSMMNYAVPEVVQVLTDTDCILYALGVGFGTEPEHPGHLRYVYEDGLEVLRAGIQAGIHGTRLGDAGSATEDGTYERAGRAAGMARGSACSSHGGRR